MRQHPGTANARYLAPPTAFLACAVALLAAPLTPWTLLVPGGYLAGVVAATALTAKGLPLRSILALPVVYTTMHMSWGLGFLTSPRSLARRPR
jgi:succinoglycan biosynthesis protein ExoA